MFLILGNGSSGTSILQRLVNAHPDIHCDFEFCHFHEPMKASLKVWKIRDADFMEQGLLYGNKLPFEQVILRFGDRWTEKDVISLSDHAKIIFNYRSFSGYCGSWHRQQYVGQPDHELFDWWVKGFELAHAMEKRNPGSVLTHCYEHLEIAPHTAMERIHDFLGVPEDTTWTRQGLKLIKTR